MRQSPQTKSRDFLLLRVTWSHGVREIEVTANGWVAALVVSLIALVAMTGPW